MCSIQLPRKRPAKGSSQIQCPTSTPNLNSWVSPPLSSPVSWVQPLENGRGHFPFWPSAADGIPHHSDFWQRHQGCSDWLSGLSRHKLPPSHPLISRTSSRLLCGSRNFRSCSLELPENPGRGSTSISQLPQSTGFLQVHPQIQTQQNLAYRKIQMQ